MAKELVNTQLNNFSFENNSTYILDWNQDFLLNRLTFKKNSLTNLLELESPKGEVVYVLEENAELRLSIASLNEAFSASRKFILNRNSRIIVACADFAQGIKKDVFNFDMEEEGSTVYFHLATLSSESDNKEFPVSFTHKASNTYAEMNNYGVSLHNSHLIFSGIGHVLKGAKHAKTHQNAKIMVFDPRCYALANPVLKIDENDVEASHAATVGRVNDEHLFYLTSRGLKEEEAKQLITLGYLKPILGYFDDDLKEQISLVMERRMK